MNAQVQEKPQDTPIAAIDPELALYKIADAMQIPLAYDKGTGEITGKGLIRLKSSAGFTIPFNVKVVKYFNNGHLGVVFHVRGDLYLIVAYFPKTSMVSTFLVDKSKITMDGVVSPPELVISKKHGLADVISTLGSAVVQSFFYKGDWKELQLPGPAK